MKIFSKLSERFHYLIDNMHAQQLNANIENFHYNEIENRIEVIYRLRMQKMLKRMDVLDFEQNYFENISSYDQLRLVKYSSLQNVLNSVFKTDHCHKNDYIIFVQKEVGDE